MLSTFARAGLLALAACLCATSIAKAAMQAPVSSAILAGERPLARVTFWGEPYPYRYVPRHHRCPLVRVETPYGYYFDRVCVASDAPVLRRAY